MTKLGRSNVFADLGLPNPEQELLKARLTLQIYKIIEARGMTQAQAGEVLAIKQPHVSALTRNRAGNFSIGRLIEFLTALGQDARITVKPTRKARARWLGGEVYGLAMRNRITVTCWQPAIFVRKALHA